MADWGASGRRDTYSFDLVDPFSLERVGSLDADPLECSLTWGYYTDNILSGTVSEVNDDFRLNGADTLVRVNHHVELPDGTEADEVLGTMFVDSVSRRSHDGVTRRSLSMYSTLWRLTQDYLPSDFARAKGRNVVDAIKNLVNTAGGRFSVSHDAPTARTFGADIWFGIGENRMEVATTIAGWIDCEIGVNPNGWVTLSPYVDPADRSVAYTFEDGTNCVYKGGIDWESSRSDPINRVVAYWSRESDRDGDGLGLSQRCVVDLPESYQFSYKRCGRYRTEVLHESEPCTLAELRDRAWRHLMDNCGDVTWITVEHPRVPGLQVGDVVDYVNSVDDASRVSVRCMVEEMSIPKLGPGCMTQSKLRILRW